MSGILEQIIQKHCFMSILKPNGLHLTKVRLNFHIMHSGFTILKFWPNYFNLFSPIRVLLDVSMEIVIKMQSCNDVPNSREKLHFKIVCYAFLKTFWEHCGMKSTVIAINKKLPWYSTRENHCATLQLCVISMLSTVQLTVCKKKPKFFFFPTNLFGIC